MFAHREGYAIAYLLTCMYVSACEYVHLSVGAYGDQKKVSGLPQLELQVAVHHVVWVLATRLDPLHE